MALFAFFFLCLLLMGVGGGLQASCYGMEYITKAKIHGFSEWRFLGFGLLLLLLPSLVVACVATTGCWLDSFCNQRDVVLVVVVFSME